jgi:glucan biosynthesis protein C
MSSTDTVSTAPSLESRSLSAVSPRLHALDAVRAFALLLGVVLHSTMPYIKGFPDWPIRERPNATLATVFYIIHMFRMPVFFLIAGFFGRMMLERIGTKRFVKDRAKRILVPLFLGFPVIFMTAVLAFVLGSLASGLTLQEIQSSVQQGVKGPPEQAKAAAGGGIKLAHLWFLYYLTMFYAGMLVLRALLGRFAPSADAVVRFIMRGFWAPLLLATPMVAYFYQNEAWLSWRGLPTPDSIIPSASGFMSYGIIFGFGWLLHRQADLLLALAKSWPIYLGTALVLLIVCRAIAGPTPRWEPYLHGRVLLIYTVAYMVGTWCWAFGLIGAALRFLSDPSPVRRYIADSSYWLYLMHVSAIFFFSVLFLRLHWHWSVKYLLTIAGSIPILLISYHYLVRFTWVGAILNGRRHTRVRATAPQPAAAPLASEG